MASGLELSPSHRAFVHQRVADSLQRHAQDLLHVDVFLKDHNGPKGGRDLSAMLRVRLVNGRLVTVEDVREELHTAVSRVAQRMAFVIRRALHQTRRLDRGRTRRAQRDRLPMEDTELEALVKLA